MKSVLFTVLAVVIGIRSLAQKSIPSSFGGGIGINYSSVQLKSAYSDVSPEYIPGFKAYLFYDGEVSQHFRLQPEFSFEGSGWKYFGSDNYSGGNQATVTTTLNYLALGILAKYRFGETPFSVFVGPGYGFLLSANVKGYNNETHSDQDSYVSGNLAVTGGAEYYFPVGVGVSLRYSGGISNLISHAASDESMHSHVFSLSVAYRFHHK